jgi:AraC-like DNA-binding protein
MLDRIRRCIDHHLPSGAPTLHDVAGELRMSPRTLQRKLRERGTSCSEVTDELRRELAVELVRREEAPLTIAFRLGFRDATSFYRAFRRWTGTTPGGFRTTAG